MPTANSPSVSDTFRTKARTGHGDTWMANARRLRSQINIGWWLQSFLPWWLGITLVGTAAILFVRTMEANVTTTTVYYTLAGSILLAALGSYILQRKNFIDDETALARLDDARGLNNALTTAHDGIGAWPTFQRDQTSPLRWRSGRVSGLLLAPPFLLAVAALFPIHKPSDETKATHQPAAWEQIQSALMEKAVQELADPERIEAMQREMEKLADRAPGDWFDHQSLETSDRLSELLSASLESMEQNLSLAANIAPQLAEQMGDNPPLDDETREKLARQMEQALQQLQNQPLGLNEETRKKLMELAPKMLQQLDEEHANQIADQLKKWAEQAGEARKGMGEGGENGEKPLWEKLLEGKEGDGQGDPKEGPGQGGLQRGPGSAPLSLSDDPSAIDPNKQEGIRGQQTELQPGEKLGETLNNREIERTEIGPREGGTADREGEGGDRVWRQQLTPSEQSLLENYFD